MWTEFFDMSGGGYRKIKDYGIIYIELPLKEAVEYFESIFNVYAYGVTCDCCGEDFSISEGETLESFHINPRKKILIIQHDHLDRFRIGWTG